MKLFKLTPLLVLIITSGLAQAHSGHFVVTGLFSGLAHPLSGFDHFIVILLVGFWSAYAFKKVWLGPVSFMVGMTVGMALGLANPSYYWLELGIAFSVMGIGILMFLQKRFSSNAILGLIGFFGAFHGFAHTEYLSISAMTSTSLLVADLIGLLIATSVLHVVGVGIARVTKNKITILSKSVSVIAFFYGVFLLTQFTN